MDTIEKLFAVLAGAWLAALLAAVIVTGWLPLMALLAVLEFGFLRLVKEAMKPGDGSFPFVFITYEIYEPQR